MKWILLFSLLLSLNINAQIVVKESLWIEDPTGNHLKYFKQFPELVIDHPSSMGFELYGPQGLKKWVKILGVKHTHLEELTKEFAADYPTSAQVEAKLKSLAQRGSSIVRLFSIGKSVQGKDLWALKISDNPDVDELEPEVKYIANMHGNEIVGRELMVSLIEEIIQKYEEGDSEIKDLVDNTEIYIIPSMNPDGADSRSRGNGSYVDLNRDFPDFSTRDNRNVPGSRAPETKAVMEFQNSRHFSLSANFHGGAVVVNYPWDTVPEDHPMMDFVVDLSKYYANMVPAMRNSSEFSGGIVNGFKWYEVNGGMQDWSYYWYGDLQVTIELSDNKWPRYSEIPSFYEAHKKPLLAYLHKVHQGAGFAFLNSNTEGTVRISSEEGSNAINLSLPFKGEFFHVLPEGRYQFELTLKDGSKKSFRAKVPDNRNNGNYVRL